MIKIEKYLANQKGEFKLFALFLRDGSLWDVLVSARWIDANKQQALKIITEQLTTKLNKDELISLSRVVVINQDNFRDKSFRISTAKTFVSETLSAINQFLPVGKKIAEIHDKNFFGLDIKQAFFFSPSRKKSLQ